jgi:hypothetical protein
MYAVSQELEESDQEDSTDTDKDKPVEKDYNTTIDLKLLNKKQPKAPSDFYIPSYGIEKPDDSPSMQSAQGVSTCLRDPTITDEFVNLLGKYDVFRYCGIVPTAKLHAEGKLEWMSKPTMITCLISVSIPGMDPLCDQRDFISALLDKKWTIMFGTCFKKKKKAKNREPEQRVDARERTIAAWQATAEVQGDRSLTD